MRNDGRLPRMLHVLVHMALLGGRETSERIALMLNTNPVVVRRTLGALRDHGIVVSEGGRGGGWLLAKPLEQITVLDVYTALNGGGASSLVESHDHPSCPVEQAANRVLRDIHRVAEEQLRQGFAATRLSDIAGLATGEAPP